MYDFYLFLLYCDFVASFPGPRPASRRLQYGKRREAGRGPGNEADVLYLSWHVGNSYIICYLGNTTLGGVFRISVIAVRSCIVTECIVLCQISSFVFIGIDKAKR